MGTGAGAARLILAGAIGLALILGAAVSDFLTGGFWERHALLASLLANVIVVAITVAVVNELLERRERRRWNLLAQSVLFALLQSARATWTELLELLGLGEVRSGSVEPLLDAAQVARDSARVAPAIEELLRSPERRRRLQRVCRELGEHAAEVIAKWAPVMVGSGPYAEVLDRHVELAGRLEWLTRVLGQLEPLEGESVREHALTRSSVASERADELGNDSWLAEQLQRVIVLATELDYDSHEHAFALVPLSWWNERRTGGPGSRSDAG